MSHAKGDLPATLPDKSDPNVTCGANGRSYTYETCMDGGTNVCQNLEKCSSDTYSLADGATAPSGWPCTVK